MNARRSAAGLVEEARLRVGTAAREALAAAEEIVRTVGEAVLGT